MEYKDYYKILEVDKNAEADEIKKAYRKLARKYHSDVNPGDKEAEQRFKEINEAQAVLANPDKRAKYDRLGASRRAHLSTGDEINFDWDQWTSSPDLDVDSGEVSDSLTGADATPTDDFSDFFAAIFRGMDTEQTPITPSRGQDYHQTVQISLEEAFKGASRVLRLGGRRIKVRIPRGAQTGTKVRVRNEGGEGQAGGPKGDLYLEIEVTPDPMFQRVNDDLHVELPIDLYTAVLGGEAIVPTFKGKIKLKIPTESQSGRTFRLKGQGMPHLKQPDQRGELYVKVMIQLPEHLTDEEFALFEELADIRGL